MAVRKKRKTKRRTRYNNTRRQSKRKNKMNHKRSKRSYKKHRITIRRGRLNQAGGAEPELPAPKPELPAPEPELPAPKPELPAPKPELPAPKPELPAPKPEWMNYTKEIEMSTDNIDIIFQIMNTICIFGEGINGFVKSRIRDDGINKYKVRIYYLDEDKTVHIAIVLYKLLDSTLRVYYICALRGKGYGYPILYYDLPVNVVTGKWPRTIIIDHPIAGAESVYKVYGFEYTYGSEMRRVFDSNDMCEGLLTQKDEMIKKTTGTSTAVAAERRALCAAAEAEKAAKLERVDHCKCLSCEGVFETSDSNCPEYCHVCCQGKMRYY